MSLFIPCYLSSIHSSIPPSNRTTTYIASLIARLVDTASQWQYKMLFTVANVIHSLVNSDDAHFSTETGFHILSDASHSFHIVNSNTSWIINCLIITPVQSRVCTGDGFHRETKDGCLSLNCALPLFAKFRFLLKVWDVLRLIKTGSIGCRYAGEARKKSACASHFKRSEKNH